MSNKTFNSTIRIFIVDALLEEALNEKVPAYVDYIWDGKEYDLFFPNSLRRFKNIYRSDVCVKVTTSALAVENINRNLKSSDFSKTNCIYICYDLFEVDPSRSQLLGINTIRDLIHYHKEAFLNYQLINPSIEIDSELSVVKPTINDIEIYDLRKEQITFEEKSPLAISLSNEARFKSSIKNQNQQIDKCALIVGNGVSIPFGSDSWSTMVANMMDYLKPFCVDDIERVMGALSDSSYSITSFVKTTIEDKINPSLYKDAIWYCIYRKFNTILYKEKTLIKVISDAKARYRNIPIFTYNYDTFIEKQFYHDYSKHGLRLGYYSGSNYLTEYHDNIIHLHGYLSYKLKNMKGIILTDNEYFDTYLSKGGSWVRDAQLYALENYSCLFVGSSMSDLFQMSIINEMFKKDDSKRWCCYALMCLSSLSLKEKIHIIHFYRMRGIRLILVDDFKQLPDKLSDLLR